MNVFSLGDRIRLVRKQLGWSQELLAKKLGIATITINKYEKGHRIPDANILNQLANIANCDPGWLLTGEGRGNEVNELHLGSDKEKELPPKTDPFVQAVSQLKIIFDSDNQKVISAILANLAVFEDVIIQQQQIKNLSEIVEKISRGTPNSSVSKAG